MLLKTNYDILQFPRFEWFTGHGILAQIPWTTNMVGVRVREKGLVGYLPSHIHRGLME